MESLLRLFNAVLIKFPRKKIISKNILKKTIPLGFIFSDEVIANFSDKELEKLARKIEDYLNVSGNEINASFHKSWQKIKTASDEQLITEQIMHYFTTYGFEALGVKSDYVFIPTEKLNIPKNKIDRIELLVIKGYTDAQIEKKISKILSSGIALKSETINDIVEVCLDLKINFPLNTIKNNEIKVIFYDRLGKVPEQPIDFLRFVVWKVTKETLLIKSKAMFKKLKSANGQDIAIIFDRFERKHGLVGLSSIFYRYKPLFLALRKTDPVIRKKINLIRKKAYLNHIPLQPDFLNTITAKLYSNKRIPKIRLENELDKVNIFRKIRLAYALKYRLINSQSIMYTVRNGKAYATEFKKKFDQNKVQKILDVVIKSIVKDLNKNIAGKKIFLPDHIQYTLPATEKQFCGNFPVGTNVMIDSDVIFGVNWKNVKSNRIDIDLSLLSADKKYGWDAHYRSGDRKILFSGDVTDAKPPNGATECFYVEKHIQEPVLLFSNYFNFYDEIPVPITIFVAKQKVNSLRKNFIIDQNDIVLAINLMQKTKQKLLGILTGYQKKHQFFFIETALGNTITSVKNEHSQHAIHYLSNYYQNAPTLVEVLKKTKAIIVTNRDDADIDLSPEMIEKDTFIKLLS